MKRIAQILFVLALVLVSVQLNAAVYNWTNGNGNNNWEEVGNWDDGSNYPGQTANDTANINGTPQINTDTITIDNLNLVGTVTNASGNLLTVAVAADINGSISAGAGGVSLAAVTLSGNSSINAAGPITITGAVNGNSDLSIDSGAGLLTLTGATFGPLINNLSLATTNNPAPLLPAIDIDNDLTVNFSGDPTVWNEGGVTIDVAGNASITSLSAIGLNSTNAGTIRLGSFTFNAVNITLNEDDSTVLSGGTAGTDLTVSSGIGTAGAITQTGAISVGNVTSLTVQNNQDILLTTAGNSFTGDVTFIASAGNINNVRLNDANDFNIQAGLSILGELLLTIGGNIDFLGAFTTTTGPLNLTATGTITALTGVGATLTVSGNTVLSAGNASAITLDDAGNNFNTLSVTQGGLTYIVESNGITLGNMIPGAQDLRLDAGGTVGQSGGTAITAAGLLLEGVGPYELMQANDINDLAIDVTNQVDFNDSDGFNLNTVQGVALARSTGDDLVLSSGGAVLQTNPISATGLLLRGAGAFTLNNGSNGITTLASDATGNIAYTDTAGITVGSVTPQTGGAVNGITSGGAAVTLTSSAGGISLTQAVSVGAGALNLSSTGGGITQNATGVISSSGTATINSAAGGNVITLNAVVNDFGTLVLDGTTVSILEANLLTLNNVNATLFDLDSGGAVIQTGATSIQTTDLLLSGAGPFTLTQGNNAVTIAGNVTGAVTFTDGTANLDVGTVSGTIGITSTNDTVILTTTAGNITVSDVVDTGAGLGNIELTSSGTIGLNAALTSGTGDIVLDGGAAVSQTVELSGAGLLLQSAGPFTLTDPQNDVDTIAADSVSGFVNFRDADGFAVGTVQAVVGLITTTANADTVTLDAVLGNITIDNILTTNISAISVTAPGNLTINATVSSVGGGAGDIDFTIGGTVTISNTVNSGGGNLIIDADGAVAQTAVVSGTGLQLLGDGPFNLSTQNNLFVDLAASITAGGTLAYNDNNAINITTVGGTIGISTAAANISVSTTAGAITVSQAVSSGSGTAGDVTLSGGGGAGTIDINNTITTGTGDLILNAGAAVNQSASFTDVTGLELLGAGPFNLNSGVVNEVTTIAMNVGGAVDYIDADDLTVGTVNTVGATLTNNLLTLETVNGGLTLAQAVNSNNGNIILNVGTTAGGTLAVNSTMTSGAGNITATTTGNVTQIAGGTVTSTGITTITADTGAADIHLNLAPNAFSTLTATGDEVRVRQVGVALVLANIDATIFTLDSDSAVTQSGIIDDTSGTNEVLLTGAGPFTLTQALNDIGTLAANVSGDITYRDSDGFAVGSVSATLPPLTENGISGAAGVTVAFQAGALLTQTQPIIAPELQLQGTGPFNLDAVGTNDVDILAANVTGQLDFEDTDDLTIGSVTSSVPVTVNGIGTAGGLLDLVAGGFIRVDEPVNTGAGQILVFDAAGTIYLSEIQLADSISTTNAAGFSLNDPIILEENSSLVSTAGNITLGAAATVNDDGGGPDTITIDSGANVSLGADIGGGIPPFDFTIRAVGASGATPAAGTDVTVSQDFIVTAGTDYNLTSQSVTAGRDVSVAGTINITGAAAVLASQDIAGAGSLLITGTATVTSVRDVSITTLTVGNVVGVATINVGQNLSSAFTPGNNLDDSDADSTVVFTNATADGSAGAYSFHNLTLNDPGNTITSTGNWTVYGTLTLTDGTWVLGANTHTIWGSWNSTLNAFTFNAAGSTVVFDGGTAATLRTDGILSESFNNILFDKTSGVTLALANNAGNTLDVTGNLSITDGRFSAQNVAAPGFDIQVAGNWIDSTAAAGDGFIHQNGLVTFIGAASNIDPGTGISPYFYNLTVTDSSLAHINDAMTVANSLTVEAVTIPAALTSNAALTTNGSLVIDAAAAAASLTMNAVFTANGAAAGSVTLQGVNSPVLDFTDQDFHFDGGDDTLDNTAGEIRLNGQQAVQDFPGITAGNEAQYGLVTYYNGGADGQIVASSHITGGTEAWFWNLTIDMPNRTLTMACDITVWGWSDPNADFTLTNNPGPVNPANLNGLRILNGTLNAELNPATQYNLSLYGMMLTTNTSTVGGLSYLWGTIPLADPTGASVEFYGPYPAYIEGDNTFFRFVVNSGRDAMDPSAIDGTVAGKFFYFDDASNTTILNHADARFIVVGDDIAPDDGARDADWISLLSGTDGVTWDFAKMANAVAIMKFVYVQDSDASVDPIVIQPRVIVSNCPGWVDFVYVTLSQTRDQLNNYTGTANAVNELPTINNSIYEPDGRIDRILVTVQAAIVKDFSGFEVQVDGYTVLGYDSGDDVPDYETLASTQFWIILEEGSYPDTGATPGWRIIDNTTVIDNSTGAPIAFYPSKDEEIPYDGAPPIIGYTLAVADSTRNEVFVHFSEPVVDDTAGAAITFANFATGVGGGVTAVNRVTPFPAPADNGMQEAVLVLGGAVNAGDITANALNLTVNNIEDIPSPNSPLADDAVDPPDTAAPLVSNTHRISDVALGIIGNGIVEPVTAIGQTQPAGGTGVGIITAFDGSDFLQDEDINLQVHRYTGQGFTPVLYWENTKLIPSSYKNSGLWIPFAEEVANSGNRPFSGLVPRPWSSGPASVPMNPVAGDLFEHDWIADSKIVNDADLEFFFRIDGGGPTNHLYAARCIDETASDWYRKIRPWSFKIRDIVTQAGGISILNNIINPNRNERTSLHYNLTQGGTVNIQVFDLAGGLVEVLQRGYQAAGEYAVSWNGRNRSGNVVARGIYFIRYVGPGGIDQIRKVLVVK